MGYRGKKEFSSEEYGMAEKHLKKCSTSLVIREMPIKTDSTSHQSEWLRSKTEVTADAGEDVEKEEYSVAGEITSWYNHFGTLEISLVVPQKIGNSFTLGPN